MITPFLNYELYRKNEHILLQSIECAFEKCTVKGYRAFFYQKRLALKIYLISQKIAIFPSIFTQKQALILYQRLFLVFLLILITNYVIFTLFSLKKVSDMKNTEFSFSVKITFVLILKSNILIERCPFQSQLSSGILLHTIFKSAFHTLQVGVFIFSLRQAVNEWRYHCLLQQQKNIVYLQNSVWPCLH